MKKLKLDFGKFRAGKWPKPDSKLTVVERKVIKSHYENAISIILVAGAEVYVMIGNLNAKRRRYGRMWREGPAILNGALQHIAQSYFLETGEDLDIEFALGMDQDKED